MPGPLEILSGIGAGLGILEQLGIFGGDSFDRQQERTASRVSNAQAERVEQGTRLRADIEQMIRELAEGGRPPVVRFGLRPGEGSDIEALMAQIAPTAELNHLLQLLGIGEGNVGAANASVSSAQVARQREEDALNQLINGLLLFGMGGGGSGASAAANVSGPSAGIGAGGFGLL